MAKQKTTPMKDDREDLKREREVLKEAKKSTNVKKGRVVKTGSNIANKEIVAKVKTVCTNEFVIVSSDITIDVVEKVRKMKVDTHADARFPCPTVGCKYKSLIIRYRNLFDHFADHCKPEGWENCRWWCDVCDILAQGNRLSET